MRTFLFFGAAFDFTAAAFLLLVAGWVVDAWHDPSIPWAGPIVTAFWLLAFAGTAGAPLLAYWRYKKGAAIGRVALAIWTPAVLLAAICAVCLTLTPP